MRVMLLILIVLAENVHVRSVCGAYMNPPERNFHSQEPSGGAMGRLVSIPVRQHANHSRTRRTNHKDVDAFSAALLRQVRNERRSYRQEQYKHRGVTPSVPIQSTNNIMGPHRAAGIPPTQPQKKVSIANRSSGELPLPPITERGNQILAQNNIHPLHGTPANDGIQDSYIQEVHPQVEAQIRRGEIQPNHNLVRGGFYPAPQKTITRTTVVEEFIIPQGTLGHSFNIQTQEIPSLNSVLPSA